MNQKDNSGLEETSAAAVLQKIKSGEISARTLSPEQRQACVFVLVTLEGFTFAQAAQLLCCSEKTIQRDIAKIKKEHAFNPGPDFISQTLGVMLTEAEIRISFLMRLARDREGSVGERAQAEFMAWKVRSELISKLQAVGCLPLVPQRIQGELYHHHDGNEEKTVEELSKELERIESVANAAGAADEDRIKQIKLLRTKLEKLSVETDIEKLSHKQEEGKHEDQQNQS